MKELYLLRHGQAEHQVRGFTGGWTDLPLTELGRQQAILTGELLRSLLLGVPFKLFTSDLKRALETAEIIGKILDTRPQVDIALRELNWGVAINMTLDEAKKLELEKTEPLIDWIPFHKAESRRMLYQRVSDFLQSIDQDHERVIIISHGNALDMCIFWWLQLPEEMQSKIGFVFDNCSVTKLCVDEWDERTIASLNCSGHLKNLDASI